MKIFKLFLCFLALLNTMVNAQKTDRDTVILFKTLPRFFYTDYNQKNVFRYWSTADGWAIKTDMLFRDEKFLTRNQLLKKIRSNTEMTGLLTNFFKLEDEFVSLQRQPKPTFYFYIYLPEKYTGLRINGDTTISCQSSYLGVGDKICTFINDNTLRDAISKKIRKGQLTQQVLLQPFNLSFKAPKKLAFYYTYDPSADKPGRDDSGHDYHITDQNYKAFKANNEPREEHGSGGGPMPASRLGSLSKDSIDILAEKTHRIIQTYKYFIRQFLTGQVMLRALPDSLSFKERTTFYTLDKLPETIFSTNRKYIDFDKRCRIFKVVMNNRSINLDTTIKTRPIETIQSEYNKLFKEVDDIKLVYVNTTLITHNPWEGSLLELQPRDPHLQDSVRGNLFYKRITLLDEINSINYTDPSLSDFKMPVLLEQLNDKVIQENYALLDSTFKLKIRKVQTAYDFSTSSQLWVQTDVNNQIISMSPFLIRAAFTTALEKFDLFELAYNQTNLKDFFEAKGRHISAQAIDNIYNDRIYSDYTNTLKFVTAHELAHIYLKSIPAKNKESLCDCYALYHLKKEDKPIETGVFETLLIRSIVENALRFWGEGTSAEDIAERYKFIKLYTNKKNLLSPAICDSLFK